MIAKEAAPVDATLEDRQYDQVLQIDVSDDSEPLSLGWNRGGESCRKHKHNTQKVKTVFFSLSLFLADDSRQAAKTFIERHSLPTSYEDQIFAFIDQVGLK